MTQIQALDSHLKSTALPIFDILLVDDDPEWLKVTPEVIQFAFEDFAPGIQLSVEIASNIKQADGIITVRKFDAVLCDVTLSTTRRFGQPEMQGDEWVLARLALLGENCLKAVVTAFPQRIKAMGSLDAAGILTIRKSTQEDEEFLFSKLLDHARQKRDSAPSGSRAEVRVAKPLGDTGRKPSEGSDHLSLTDEVERLFMSWLTTRSGPDRKMVQIGNRLLSINELKNEISNGTTVGKRLVRMFVAELSARMGLDR